ncbi:phosphatase PAP2 family protein [Ancylobacter rudongensis]|uniref:Membrane-associated enzyme, PAP2 (Acid phosphatase) superfamily n=1 Tax=Ancylobacter rudongensis TaxID=177413 RepID=A0A1G4TXA3_9HYPH|nr:phosphatase PAP2 family protein [Ancylobacter rudongensis]SCW85984.1 Membrane-associated enzyme, PAP2 (acid phosphatase) superfamily [Ancylobacter rudongensis]
MADPNDFPRDRASIFARAPLSMAILGTALVSVVFYLVPQIDLAFLGLFYEPGKGFPAAQIPLLQDFRTFASNISLFLPLLTLVCLVLKLSFPAKTSLLPSRMALFFIPLFLLGPGLLVNGILKPYWGRPRPLNVSDFGGPWPFEDPWVIGPSGLGNHSFSSGEAATTACLLPLILFLPREWRGPVGALIGLFVAAVGLNRIAFGGHFLSDVVISIGLMLILAAVLHHLIFVRYRDSLSDAALEKRLTALGYRMAEQRAALRHWVRRTLATSYQSARNLRRAERAIHPGAAARAAAMDAPTGSVGASTGTNPP